MVFVKIAHIARMVHTVMARGIKNFFKGSHALDGFGMNPVLVNQTQLHHGHYPNWVKAQKWHPTPPAVFIEDLCPALAEGYCEVIID